MNVAVIGAGSWGTALSQLLASNEHHVRLWARKSSVAEDINTNHVNPRYLTDMQLSPLVASTTSYEEALADAEACVIVTPSTIAREIARDIAPYVCEGLPVVICSKGIENGTGLLMTEVLEEELGNAGRLAALCGPNHAEEVIQGIPAATVIASTCSDTAVFFQDLFATGSFRVYVSDDIYGVELCAASKNIIAIAVGISYGLGYGDNTASMIITRGLAEMSRLVQASGGEALTCMGLAGAGDLVATCMSKHSRNRKLGLMVAQGKTLEDFTAETHMVAEGAYACKTVDTLAKRNNVELPIAEIVRRVVWDGFNAEAASDLLMSRPLGAEFY